MGRGLFQELPRGSRILFLRLRNLGEAVLDTANLRALRAWRPDLEITVLVEALYEDLFIGDPDLHVLPLERGNQQTRSRLAARISVVREIRRRRFHAVVNLHGGPTSAQLTLLSGARYRVGAAHFRPQWAYNLHLPAVDVMLGEPGISQTLHTVENQWAGFRWLGLPTSSPGQTRLHVVPAYRESAAEKLRAVGIDPRRPYAVLAPTNEFATKRWLPERFARVADWLEDRGWQVVLTGAPTLEQQSQLAAVVQQTRQGVATLSQLRIGELVAIIDGAGLLVGNDSGPAHLATAVSTPHVVLFGPASSVRWRPWVVPEAKRSLPLAEVVQNPFPCNPCSMFRCEVFPEPECIRSIRIEQVWQAIERVVPDLPDRRRVPFVGTGGEGG
jgi:heptosyltransferase-3